MALLLNEIVYIFRNPGRLQEVVMVNIEDKTLCCGCSACADVCPVQAIAMKKDEEGFLYPHINMQTCVHCNRCDHVCPVESAKSDAEDCRPLDTLAAVNRNPDIRKSSSSGGVFSLLAEKVLGEGGVVYGAAFDDRQVLRHMGAENQDALEKMRCSKYVQSSTEKIFPAVREALRNGRPVLFTGTPCQVAALKSYIGPEDENLLCADIVCHGVPSPDLWHKYCAHYEKTYTQKIQSANMRDKTHGWRKYETKLQFSDGSSRNIPADQNFYVKSFINNYSLRPICYHCPFKNGKSGADLTLGDCWGIENILPEMDDDGGISLILVKTEKGAGAFSQIPDEKIQRCSIDYDAAVKYNPAIVRSSFCPPERKTYCRDSRRMSINFLTNRYYNCGFFWRILRKVMKVF